MTSLSPGVTLAFRCSAVPPALRRPPEPPERPHVGAVAQLLEGALADLADALAGDAEQRADLLERQGLGALLETVVEREDLALAGREMALEETVDELALERSEEGRVGKWAGWMGEATGEDVMALRCRGKREA